MTTSILTEKEFSKVSKVKKKFDIFRVVLVKDNNMEVVEFFNKDGVFRGFGKSTQQAFKNAKNVAKNFYK